jgi:hypothetical protein
LNEVAPKDVIFGEFVACCVGRFAQEAPDEERTAVIGVMGRNDIDLFQELVEGAKFGRRWSAPGCCFEPGMVNGGGGHEYEDNFDSGGKA